MTMLTRSGRWLLVCSASTLLAIALAQGQQPTWSSDFAPGNARPAISGMTN